MATSALADDHVPNLNDWSNQYLQQQRQQDYQQQMQAQAIRLQPPATYQPVMVYTPQPVMYQPYAPATYYRIR